VACKKGIFSIRSLDFQIIFKTVSKISDSFYPHAANSFESDGLFCYLISVNFLIYV